MITTGVVGNEIFLLGVTVIMVSARYVFMYAGWLH